MKHRSAWTKALLLALCAAFVLTAFVGCVSDEDFEDLKSTVQQLQNGAKDTATKLEQVETKETVAALKALVEQIKATADAAATTTKLEEAIATLTAKDLADATAATAAIAEAKAAVEALITANGTQDAATKATLESVQTSLNTLTAAAATKAELQAALNELNAGNATDAELAAAKTELEGKITEVDGKITAAKTEIEGKIAAAKTELEGKITALNTKYDALAAAVGTADAGLVKDVADLKAAIEALQNDNFAAKYEEASKILLGQTLLDEDEDGEDDMLGGVSKYSLAGFDYRVAEIADSNNYALNAREAFEKTAADIRFFLNRALSKEDILARFEQLEEAIAAMPTLLQSLQDKMTEIEQGKLVTAEIASIQSLIDIKDQIDSQGVIVEAADLTRYENITAAQKNLADAVEDAVDVDALIDAIPAIADILFNDYGTIDAAKAAFDTLEDTYFSEAAYTALYNNITAESLVDYETLANALARKDELIAAFAVLPTIDLNVAVAQPLYTDKAALEENLATVDAWIAEYALSDANVALMYTAGQYTALTNAVAYATAMDAIFTDLDVTTLKANIEALIAEGRLILFTDKTNADAYAELLTALQTAINEKAAELNGDGTTDVANYQAMIGAENLTKFADAQARIAELVDVKAEVDAIYALMVEMEERKVGFSDYSTITGWLPELLGICDDHDIVVDDANYVELIKAAVEKQAKLKADYDALTGELAAIYEYVYDATHGKEWPLSSGNDIFDLNAKFEEILDRDVTNTDIDLTIEIDTNGDGVEEAVEVNLNDLYTQWFLLVGQYQGKANNAVTGAGAVNDAIAALEALKVTDVKDLAAIQEKWDIFAAWANAHLGIALDADKAEFYAAVAAIQGINKLDGSGDQYVFITLEDYVKLQDAHNEAVANKAAANEKWAEIAADMNALMTEWNIHSDFQAVVDAYNLYVTNFYAGSITDSTDDDTLNEVDLYNTFMAEKALYDAAVEAAGDLKAEIEAKIDALTDVDFNNVADVKAACEAIRAKIAEYNRCDILTCDKCGLSDERLLALAKAEAKVAYTEAYKAAYEAQAGNVDNQNAIMGGWNTSNQSLANATTPSRCVNIASTAISALDALIATF